VAYFDEPACRVRVGQGEKAYAEAGRGGWRVRDYEAMIIFRCLGHMHHVQSGVTDGAVSEVTTNDDKEV
jgi:hypothetical protein